LIQRDTANSQRLREIADRLENAAAVLSGITWSGLADLEEDGSTGPDCTPDPRQRYETWGINAWLELLDNGPRVDLISAERPR